MNPGRRELVLGVLRDEIGRQSPAGTLDLIALADAIETALAQGEPPAGARDTDGKEPDELNASNDV